MPPRKLRTPKATPKATPRATPKSTVKSPKVAKQQVQQVQSTDSYAAMEDDGPPSVTAEPTADSSGPQLPYARALVMVAVLLVAAIALALVATANRASPPLPPTNSSSSSSSSGAMPYLSSSSLPSSTASPASPSLSSSASSTASTNASTPILRAQLPPNGTVHVVFSSHLDVGFTTLSGPVIQRYFDDYFPLAVNLSRALHNTSTPYVYMSHGYLLSLLLDCPPHMGFACPPAQLVKDVAAVVADGGITFHAFPFNSELEFYTREQFEAGMQSTFALADRLGRKGGRPNTISQRDVPGATIAIIPSMVRNGVKAFSIGGDGGAAPAEVGTISRWQANGQEVYLLFHGGGYDGTGVADAVVVPGWDHVLLMQWNVDNSGPLASVQQVQSVYADIQREFPGWTVRASTFDSYIDLVDAAVKAGTISLPVVSREMGDTWSYGFGSDPRRSGEWTVLQRLHAQCTSDPACDSTSSAFHNFTRLLLKGGEQRTACEQFSACLQHRRQWSADQRYRVRDGLPLARERLPDAEQVLEGCRPRQRLARNRAPSTTSAASS